jgi:DNA-binding response OmpR family regulator
VTTADPDPRGLVLVVEDDRAIADLIRLYLVRAGFGVHVEGDGAGALLAAARLAPAAVVLDVGLPGVDGVEVCRQLRASGDWTPVLFVTARDDEVDRIVGLELGADDYVTKPFSPRELVARIRAVLRRVAGPAGREEVLALGPVRVTDARPSHIRGNASWNSPEHIQLRRSRRQMQTISEDVGRRQFGLPVFLLSGAFVSDLIGAVRAVVVPALGSRLLVIVLTVAIIALFSLVAATVLQAASIARMRLLLVLAAPLTTLYQTIGSTGEPPRDHCFLVAVIALVLFAVAAIAVPGGIFLLLQI